MNCFVMCSGIRKDTEIDEIFIQEYRTAIKYSNVYLCNDMFPQVPVLPNSSKFKKIIYYGWTLPAEQYQVLYDDLKFEGYELINSPKQYIFCNYFDSWYPALSDLTPESIIIPRNVSTKEMLNAVLDFQNKTGTALIIRDSLSSLKYEWEKCFIPKNASIEAITRILINFCNAKNKYKNFYGSLIVRKFVPVKKLGMHETGAPVMHKMRAFIINGTLHNFHSVYDNRIYNYDRDVPEKLLSEVLERIYNQVGNNLFTIDVAKLDDNSWTCIGIQDGQTVALQPNANMNMFFQSLAREKF